MSGNESLYSGDKEVNPARNTVLSMASGILTRWMQEATIVAQNNYSTPYHLAREANIMAQRPINVFLLYVCVFASTAFYLLAKIVWMSE